MLRCRSTDGTRSRGRSEVCDSGLATVFATDGSAWPTVVQVLLVTLPVAYFVQVRIDVRLRRKVNT